jgi:hypothetical protein
MAGNNLTSPPSPFKPISAGKTGATLKQYVANQAAKNQIITNTSVDKVGRKIESPAYLKQFFEDQQRFVPDVDFSDPSNFAFFGSAEQYYLNSAENIYRFYPYDGSEKEKLEWHNEASYLDNYIFEYEYPRTNGYIEIGETWGSIDTTKTVGSDSYSISDAPQYIFTKGGPNAPSVPAFSSGSYTKSLNFKEKEQKANIFDSNIKQTQNLNINGNDGNTVEFWFKYPNNPLSDQQSKHFCYFDLWNGQTIDSITPGAEYGRLMLETKLDATASPREFQETCLFNVTYRSGSSGVLGAKIGRLTSNVLGSVTSDYGINLDNWNHFAFSMENHPTGSDHLLVNLYINGSLVESTHTGSQIGEVKEGPFNATVGAYRTGPNAAAASAGVTQGYGSISGSYDEFRFWKKTRDSSQISFNWFKQTTGGANTDYGTQDSKFTGSINPVDLGVYYKFNEGITLTSSIDSVVLDYSGRVSNGSVSNYTSAMRSTGSAIVIANAAETEFRDPIIYSFHPSVVSYIQDVQYKGREYDGRNSMFLYNTLPTWILDEDSNKNRFNALRLMQIMASYFDNLYLQAQELPSLKDIKYLSGSVSGSSIKPLPFAEKLLTNSGFPAPQIFTDGTVFELLADRNDEFEFKRKLSDVKNEIYTNLYNNLITINKSKGTEKSIRNILHCFGVDEDIYSINFYPDNANIELSQSPLARTLRKSYADFNDATRFDATVFQMTASSNSNSVSYITGSGYDDDPHVSRELPFTVEAEVIFPKKPSYSDPNFKNKEFASKTVSLFGMHTVAFYSDDNQSDTTWNTDIDLANFQVYAIKQRAGSRNSEHDDVYFKLTSSGGNASLEGAFPVLTSSVFRDTYLNEKWNFAIKVRPSRYPNVGILSGSENTDYKVDFIGYNAVGDSIQNSFHLTGTIKAVGLADAQTTGQRISQLSKRMYAGSHRQNFTGSLLTRSDVKVSSCRFWMCDLTDEEIKSHALDPTNFGVFTPERNTFILQGNDLYSPMSTDPFPNEIPRIKTLLMNWDFDNITGSDSGELGGEFSVADFSSGSSNDTYTGIFNKLIEKQHTGRGTFFPDSNNYTGSISREYVQGMKQQVPENFNNASTVQILNRDDEFFTRRTKPITFSFAIEKSMYQAVSEEMLNFIAASKDASGLENAIGDPVNRYRGRYKDLEFLRQFFFERVSNTPDVDKYLEFYKWLDQSISEMVQHVVPASSNFRNVSNVIESHVLERPGKYRNKFPITTDVLKGSPQIEVASHIETADDGTTSEETINQITVDETGRVSRDITGVASVNPGGRRTGGSRSSVSDSLRGTVSENTTINVDMWHDRADRKEESISSGDPTIDLQRNNFKDIISKDNSGLGKLTSEAMGEGNIIGGTDGATGMATLQFGQDTSRSRPKHGKSKKGFLLNYLEPGSGKSMIFNTEDLVPARTINWDLINPSRTYKPEFKVTLSSDTDGSSYLGRLVSPYTFFSGTFPTSHISGYQLTSQHHRDFYVETKEVPAQGPFTQQNVGGYAYRHGGRHVDVGQTTRVKPEAWYAFRTPVGSNIKYNLYSPFDLTNGENYPRAQFMRDEVAKRPLNIKNIKSTTESALPQRTDLPPLNELGNTKNYVGNYDKDYQILSVGGRHINNKYLVKSGSISTASIASTGTPSISGAYDWAVPNRGRNEYIFVSKFSAPGGPEIAGAAFNDYTSDTFSPYNALPFRNLSVRQPLSTLLTRHTAFGGYDSELGSPSASYKKIQRNGRRYIQYTDIFETAITGTVYDNSYVQHQIPQSDRQYSWITASAITTPLGFSQRDFDNRSFASTDITFVTSSEFGAFINTTLLPNGKLIFGRPYYAAGQYFLPQDFVGMNNFSYLDSDEMDLNTVSFVSNNDGPIGATTSSVGGISGNPIPQGFHTNLLKLNGPYGHPTWKQIQNSYHPIVRYMNKINRLSVLTESINNSPGDAKLERVVTRGIQNFTEPSVYFKYKPFEHTFDLKTGDSIVLKNSYSNNLVTFSDIRINDLLDYYGNSPESQLYSKLKKVYIDGQIPKEYNTIESLDSVKYREVVYPRERNTGLAKTRGRENYTVSSGSDNFNLKMGDSRAFWKNNISDRLRSDAEARNAEGLIIASGSSYFGLTDMSIWPLDAEEPFYDLYQVSSSDGSNNPYYWAPLSPSSAISGLDPATTSRFNGVSRNGELSYAGWLYSLMGINIQGKVRADGAPTGSGPLPNFRLEQDFNPTASFQYEYPNMMMSGAMVNRGVSPSASLHLMAPYRADVLSGKTPWFNSYEDYAEDIRRMAKDYTVLPEFRISDHMDYYLNEGFFADNNKFMDLVGASLNNTSSATNETGSFQADFFKIYSHSDFMKHFNVIQEDHKKDNTAFASKIRLEANAVKKLLPYQGFYPALRSVQLGHLFSSSYSPYLTGSNVRDGDQERLAALYQPFFAPGIFFNTIKSGIAVSYPVHTASAPVVDKETNLTVAGPTIAAPFISNLYTTTPNYLFPFEAILDPDQYLPLSSSLTSSGVNNLSSSVFLVYPNFTGSAAGDIYFDHFYTKQTADSPYTTLVTTSESPEQPQMYFEWKGQSEPKYSLAASNFFAEAVDFFLDKGTLTSFISKPEKDFNSMVSGSTYYMDVLLYKTDNYVSYEGAPSGTFNYDGGAQFVASVLTGTWNGLVSTLGDGLLNAGISARGMHYGPSYKSHGLIFGSTGTGSVPYASFRAQDPTYAPHTPPYFYGTSRARIAFKPHKVRDMEEGEASKFTLEEILSNAKVETTYENDNQMAKTLQENSHRDNYAAGIAQMQLSSSVNLFGQITLKEVQYGTERNPDGTFKAERATTPVVQGTNDAWIIETKFECPSINMANMDTGSLGAGIGDGKEKYHTRGIWKGYGEYPTGSEGIFLQLKESYPQVINDYERAGGSELTGSLIEVCGFKASKERVGKIKGKKTISEAIVAVPIDEKGNFFPIDPRMFAKQKSNHETQNKALLAGDFGVETDIGETSITQMIEKMGKFSLPPQMDFLNNPNIDPFVMYLFEFTHALDKKDLADIWQNLMPKISTTAERGTSAIEHPIGVNYEFFGQYKKGQLPDNIRWMVFKVKQKARNNFFNITQQSEVAKGFTFTALKELQGIASDTESELTYSYNWPYDFFSLVELAQIESEVTFEPPEE